MKGQSKGRKSDAMVTEPIAAKAMLALSNTDVRQQWSTELEDKEPHLDSIVRKTMFAAVGRMALYCNGITEAQVEAACCELRGMALLVYQVLRDGYSEQALQGIMIEPTT